MSFLEIHGFPGIKALFLSLFSSFSAKALAVVNSLGTPLGSCCFGCKGDYHIIMKLIICLLSITLASHLRLNQFQPAYLKRDFRSPDILSSQINKIREVD